MSERETRPIPNTLQIELYLHCGLCLDSLPPDTTPQEWAQIEVGWTTLGLQVWCKRHNCNMVHIDFEGQTHPANATRKKETEVQS